MTPTALLTAWIATNFPNSAGYNDTMRAQLLAFALSVNANSNFAANDSPGPIEGLLMATINTSKFGNLPSDKKLLVLQMCEYAVAINFTATTGPKLFKAFVAQAGVNPFTYARLIDGVTSTGLAAPVASRNAVGEFTLTFSSAVFPGVAQGKVACYLINLQAGVKAVGIQTATNAVTFTTVQESTDSTVPGVNEVSGSPSDGKLFGTEILVIEVYPA